MNLEQIETRLFIDGNYVDALAGSRHLDPGHQQGLPHGQKHRGWRRVGEQLRGRRHDPAFWRLQAIGPSARQVPGKPEELYAIQVCLVPPGTLAHKLHEGGQLVDEL